MKKYLIILILFFFITFIIFSETITLGNLIDVFLIDKGSANYGNCRILFDNDKKITIFSSFGLSKSEEKLRLIIFLSNKERINFIKILNLSKISKVSEEIDNVEFSYYNNDNIINGECTLYFSNNNKSGDFVVLFRDEEGNDTNRALIFNKDILNEIKTLLISIE